MNPTTVTELDEPPLIKQNSAPMRPRIADAAGRETRRHRSASLEDPAWFVATVAGLR